MHLENQQLWWIFALLGAFLMLELRAARRRNRSLKQFGVSSQNSKQRGSASLRIAGMTLLFFAIIRPQWGFEWKEGARKGVDIVVTVDLSNSMLTKDVPPSRLDRARFLLIDLLKRLQGDRIGLVVFAGTAYVQSPLTYDYGAFRGILEQLSPDLVPLPGSNIYGGLEKSLELLVPTKQDEENKTRGRAIILLTDGEELQGEAKQIRERAQELGVKIYVVGIGTAEGAPVPFRNGFKRDREGNIIVSRLKPEVLQDVAKETGGVFIRSTGSGSELSAVYEGGIKQSLQGAEFGTSKVKRYNEYYQLPLFFALLAILFEAYARCGRGIILSIMFVLAFVSPKLAFATPADRIGHQGKQLLDRGEFEGALKEFSAAEEEDPRLIYGQGMALYRLGRFNEAHERFSRAAQFDSELKAKAIYNEGNALVQLGKYQEAVSTYEEALKLAPGDQETIENLEYTKKLLEKPNQDQKNQEQQKQQQEKNSGKDQKGSSGQNQDEKDGQKQQQNQKPQEGNSDQKEDSSGKSEKDSTNEQEEGGEENQPTPKDDGEKAEKENRSDSEQQDGRRLNNQSPGQQGKEQKRQEQDSSQEPGEALLNNVEENRDALKNFRRAQAIKELRESDAELPEQDW